MAEQDALDRRIATLRLRAEGGSELRLATAAWEMLALADSLARFDPQRAGGLALDVYLSSAPREARRLALSDLVDWDLAQAEPLLRLIGEGRQDADFQPLLGYVFNTPRPWSGGRPVARPDRSA